MNFVKNDFWKLIAKSKLCILIFANKNIIFISDEIECELHVNGCNGKRMTLDIFFMCRKLMMLCHYALHSIILQLQFGVNKYNNAEVVSYVRFATK
jgi:hypothetical protein